MLTSWLIGLPIETALALPVCDGARFGIGRATTWSSSECALPVSPGWLVIGIVVPAHNEAGSIGDCLDALARAAASPSLKGEACTIVVVLDDCSDDTDAIALSKRVQILTLCARNVGAARAVGAEYCLAVGARWLAFTDADTVVSDNWIAAQLALCADAVCGTIGVGDWGDYGEPMRKHFEVTYTDADGHRHIHGANLGVSAEAYRRSGGFSPLPSSEDVALVDSLMACGASIAWSAVPRVATSARKDFRAPGGFGATLATLIRVDAAARKLVASC